LLVLSSIIEVTPPSDPHGIVEYKSKDRIPENREYRLLSLINVRYDRLEEPKVTLLPSCLISSLPVCEVVNIATRLDEDDMERAENTTDNEADESVLDVGSESATSIDDTSVRENLPII